MKIDYSVIEKEFEKANKKFPLNKSEQIGLTIACKCQYKNVGLLQNKNVIKPTFLFCNFNFLLI